MVKCPNLSLPENQALINKYGLIEFFNLWLKDETDFDPEYSDEVIRELKFNGGLIEGYTGPQQDSIVRYFTAEIIQGRKENSSAQETLESIFKDFQEDYEGAVEGGQIAIAGQLKLLLDKKADFELVINQKLKQLSQKTIDQEADDEDGEENSSTDDKQPKDKNYSKEAYEEDPFASTSPRLRSLFFMVKDLDENGQEKTNFLGMPAFKEASEIVPKLQLITAELTHEEITNSGKLQAALQDYIKEEPWIKSIVDLLNNRDQRYWIELSKFLSKHQIKMITAVVDDKKQVTKLKTFDTNQNSIEKETVRQWQAKQVTLPLVGMQDGNMVIDANVRKKLIDEYIDLIAKPTQEGILNWLSQIGIDLHPDTIKFIINEGSKSPRTDRLDLDSMVKDTKGWFNRMYKALKQSEGEGENQLSINNPLFNNPGIRKLARLETKFNKSTASTSFINGENKIIATFSNNKYASIQFKRLMEDPNYAKQLLESDFSKNSWFLKMLAENNAQFKETWSFNYADTIRIESSNQDSKTLDQCTDTEYELYKLSLFVNNMFLYPTMSDKKAAFIMKSLVKKAGLIFDNNGDFDINNETIDEYFKPLESELQRNEFLQANGDQNIGGFDDSNNQVLLYFPELNTIDVEDPNYIEGLFSQGIKGLITNNTPDVREALREWLRNRFKEEVKNQIKDWKDLSIINSKNELQYIDNSYVNKLSSDEKLNDDRKATAVAANYILNNALFKHNIMQAFVDDPMFYWKGDIDETWVNVGKRLASENAPGFDLIDVGANHYNQAFISNPKMTSRNLEYYKKLGLSDEAIKKYENIDGTDAQEYTTLAEHLYVMYHTGKLSSKEDYDKLLLKALAEEKFSDEELGILQPHKPVYRETLVNNHLNRPVYIKTSSFPLIPQLTKGLAIDRVRVVMKNKSLDRLVMKSGGKVGLPSTLGKVFDSAGDIKDDIEINDSNILSLPRTGLRIQQEVPYDSSKSKINTVSQADKLITADLPDRLKPVVEKYFNLKRELYKLHFDSFEKEFGLVANNGGYSFDIEKMSKALIQEGIQRNYSINDIKALEVKDGKFIVPLFFNNSGLKVQNALMAIMDKRLRKLKMPGFSGILGAEAGFETTKEWESLSNDQKSDIVFINKTHPGLEHNEILVPFKFRDSKGNLLNVKDFVKEDGTLDTERIPEELLKLLGFRIPNQGKSSMISLKIAGFLPSYMGDLVIASRDLTQQMGSDFDVDKLYMYMYNAVYNEVTGKFSKYKKEGNVDEDIYDDEYFDEETEELGELLDTAEKKGLKRQMRGREPEIQNEIIDVFHEILNDPDVLKQVKDPLGFGKLQEVKEEILKLKPVSKLSPLSPMYDRQKYLSARGGKAGTGVYSVSNTLNAVLQGKNIYIQKLEVDPDTGKKIIVEDHVYFTSKSNKLSDSETKNGQLKSKVHAAFQSAAVDEEKEQLLSNLNINVHTFDVTTGAAQLGFDEEEIAYLLNQPAILYYIEQVIARSSVLAEEFDPAIKETVFEELTAQFQDISNHEYNKTDIVSVEELKKCIGKDKTATDYHKIQLLALNKFIEFEAVGKNLRQIASAINSDSKGLPKDIIELVNKIQQVKDLGSMLIHNAQATLGRISDIPQEGYVKIDEEFYLYPTTIPGMATAYALATAYQTYKNLVPYESPDFVNITEWINVLSGKSLNTPFKKGEFTRELSNVLRSYYYTDNTLGIYKEDSQLIKNRLLLGDNSLARRIVQLQSKTTNKFIRRITPQLSIDGGVDYITFNAATRETLDENEIHRAFAQLFIDESTRDLAEDLVSYSYLTGGLQQAIQFIKYIPFAYLKGSGMVSKLNELNSQLFSSSSVENITAVLTRGGYPFVPETIVQLIQSHPEYSQRIPSLKQLKSVTKNANKKIISFIPILETLYVDGDKKGLPKELVHIKEDGQLVPFKYNNTSETYVRMDILGSFPIQEFNANGPAKTVFEKNKADVTPAKETTKQTPLVTVKIPNPLAGEFKLSNMGIQNGPMNRELIDYLIKGADGYYSSLGKVLSENFDMLFDVEVILDDTLGGRGAYDYKTNILYINPKKITNETGFKSTITEELFHALTTKALKNPTTDKQKQVSKAVTTLREHVATEIKKAFPKEFATYQEKIKNGMSGVVLTQQERDIFYGVLNDSEFVAQVFKQPEFQKFLNGIEYGNSNRTFLERFVQLIKVALQNIGIDIKPNSALDVGINEMFKLLEKEEVKSTEEISSNAKGILAALTNPTEIAKRKGNISQSYPIRFGNRIYKDVEEAYQDLKSHFTNDDGPNNTYSLMVSLIKAKLEQHPKLTQEITKLGGSEWILSKTHQPTNKNTVWETGGKNWFIKALNEAYKKVVNSNQIKNNNPSDYTNHSGGAKGGDTWWDIIGRQFGVTKHKHYREPEQTEVDSLLLQKEGIKATPLDEKTYNEGQPKATIAARQMGRIEQNHQVRSNYIIRNWAQVKNADAIYAVGTIISKGTPMNNGRTALIEQVKGGTGYAVQMAINEGKPVYVYDGTKDSWFKWNGKTFEKTITPTLTKNFAGIGSRTLSTQEVIDKSYQAIRDVYENTFKATPQPSTNAKVIPLNESQRFTRESVKNDPEYIYLFTDNAERTSGSNLVDPNSWYADAYGKSKKFPTMTQAAIRGLNNAFPITTMIDDKRTQWTDDKFKEFQKEIDHEIRQIQESILDEGFKGIKFSAENPFGQGKISNMKQTAPKIWNYLNTKLVEIGIDNTGNTPTVITTQPSTSVNEFDLADKLTPIEQNFADGTGGRAMQPQFKGKSTMDLIISGDRTRTTRAKTDIQRMAKDYSLSKISDLVGKVIRMTDKTGRQVYTRITKVVPFTQEYQDATWQKEGWVKSVTDKHVGDYPYAIEFEIVNKPTIQPVGQVKEGVQELFESNPELANAVYEALGFKYLKNFDGNVELLASGIASSYDGAKKASDFISDIKKDLQQAQQLYSQYLDSVFPDSKVKDIVYHGSPIKGLQEIKRGDDNQGKMYTSKYGITFTDNDLSASIYAGQISINPNVEDNFDNGQVYPALLNLKNFTIQDFNNESYGGKFGSAIGIYNNALEKAKKDNKDGFIAKNIADPSQNQTNYVVFEPKQIHILGNKQDVEGFKEFVNKFKKEINIETISSSIYKDGYGNFYKFDLLKSDPDTVVKGYYSQGNINNWNEMSDKTTNKKFYDEFETLEEVVENPNSIQTDLNKLTINGIELNTGNIVLNVQQVQALQDFANFADSIVSEGWNNSTYSLQGYAGTGKTTITKFIVQYLKKKGKNYALSSPTHRAKEVLQDLTGERAMTVAKVLGLSPGVDVENFNLVDKQFQSQQEIKIPSKGILIVDEASMVNDALFDMLVSKAEERGTKILFIGDEAQLKPVKQKQKGKAFRREINISKLTKVMRTNDGNPMPAEVLQPIRDNPQSKVDMFDHTNKVSPAGEGIIFVKDSKEWMDSLLEKMSLDKLNENPNFVRALAYTNKRVKDLNTAIRAKMFGIGAEDFYVGELLMMYENLFFVPGGDYIYPNGMDVRVESIEYKDDHEINVPDTNAKIKVAGYVLNTSRTKTKSINQKPLFVADIDKVSPEYVKELVRLKNRALTASGNQRGMAWAQFFDFSASYNLTDEIYFVNDNVYNSRVEAAKVLKQLYPTANASQLEMSLNKSKAKDKSVDYAYAHTIHKSQGGTYDFAYVDEGNIDIARNFPNPDYEMINQLKYVGFSRSSKLTVSLTQKSENNDIIDVSSISLPTEKDLNESIKICKL